MNPAHEKYELQAAARTALVTAARKIADGRREQREAVLDAARNKLLPFTEIAALADISRPTIYDWLREDTEGMDAPNQPSGDGKLGLQ